MSTSTTGRRAVETEVRRAFEEEYRWLHPAPKREDFAARDGAHDAGPWMGRAWTIGFIVVASITISGLRTASLFAALANHHNAPAIQLVEGLAAVALVELGIVLTGFRAEKLRQENRDKPRHVASVRDLWRGLKVRLGMAAPLAHAERPEPSIIPPLHNALFWAALAANIWVSLQVALAGIPEATTLSVGAFVRMLPAQPVETLAELAIAFIVGAVPPIAAKAAGEAAARDLFRTQSDTGRSEDAYQEALEAWRAGFRAAWEKEGRARVAAVLNAPHDATHDADATHNAQDAKAYACECGAVFDSPQAYAAHKRWHCAPDAAQSVRAGGNGATHAQAGAP